MKSRKIIISNKPRTTVASVIWPGGFNQSIDGQDLRASRISRRITHTINAGPSAGTLRNTLITMILGGLRLR